MDSMPQEIVDDVIDNLAFDFETLKSTSLVRKSWTHRSRRRLFYFVAFNSLGRLEKWSLSIPPDPNGIASYPRAILLSLETLKSWVEPANLEQFYDHFRSFSAVERLVISGLQTPKFDAISTARYFGNFAATVRSLELRTTVGCPAAFLSFVCAFPLLDDLSIQLPVSLGGEDREEVVQHAAAPRFGGKLRLLDMSCESYPLIELLCTLPLSFHTISVSSRDPGRLPQLAKLTNKCGKTLRSLHITKKTYGTYRLLRNRRYSVGGLRRTILATWLGPTGVSLALCVALEELRVTVVHPKHLITILGEVLPTLANTTNLSRIVLDAGGGASKEEDFDKTAWNSLDAIMSEYAEKISGKHRNRRLALVFRTGKEGATGEFDGWAGELARLLVLFPKVGDVEFVSKY